MLATTHRDLAGFISLHIQQVALPPPPYGSTLGFHGQGICLNVIRVFKHQFSWIINPGTVLELCRNCHSRDGNQCPSRKTE